MERERDRKRWVGKAGRGKKEGYDKAKEVERGRLVKGWAGRRKREGRQGRKGEQGRGREKERGR